MLNIRAEQRTTAGASTGKVQLSIGTRARKAKQAPGRVIMDSIIVQPGGSRTRVRDRDTTKQEEDIRQQLAEPFKHREPGRLLPASSFSSLAVCADGCVVVGWGSAEYIGLYMS